MGTTNRLLIGWRELLEPRFSYVSDLRRIYALLPGALRRRFWVVMFLASVRAFVETSTIVVIALFTQSVSSPDSVRSGRIYRGLARLFPDYALAGLNNDRTLVILMCFLVVAFIVMKNVIFWFTLKYTATFMEQVDLHISEKGFSQYFARDYLWHISPEREKFVQGLEQRNTLILMCTNIIQVFGNIFCILVMFMYLFSVNPEVIFVMVVVFLAVGGVSYALLRTKIDRAGSEVGRIGAKQGWSTRMAMRGIREIIIYKRQKTFLGYIVDSIEAAVPSKTFLAISPNIPGWFLEISGFVIIFGAMVYMVQVGRPLPEVVNVMSLLLLTAWRTLPLVSRSMGLAVNIRGERSRARFCLGLLETFTGLTDPDHADRAGGAERDPDFHIRRGIELREVFFRYPGKKLDCLRAINLVIARGESIGLIGASGSGKTTLATLIAGLFPPRSGIILVDDLPLGKQNLDSYRQRVGFVPQNPLLLPGSVADNIALSQWGEKYDMDKMRKVCEMAALDFVLTNEKGLNLAIGEGGEGLSGGQAQRISVARALYTNPEIVIFDEATSSLDRASETVIENTLKMMRGKITALVIAHRLTSVEHCDKIIWLENGAIREVGRTEDILPKYQAVF